MNYEYLSNELLKAHLKSLPEEDQKAIQSSFKERLKTSRRGVFRPQSTNQVPPNLPRFGRRKLPLKFEVLQFHLLSEIFH